MNGDLKTNSDYFQHLSALVASQPTNSQLGIAVPAPYFNQASDYLAPTPICWGAQDISAIDKGARTSEISATMLHDFNCSFCIIGHSERRQYWNESDTIVANKVSLALDNGITPVCCVGETETQRNHSETSTVISAQIKAVSAKLSNEQLNQCIIAYEPVWAIGTGKSATPEMAQEVHQLIRQLLPQSCICPILYGGSVNENNAAELFTQPDINGALVGGASLKAESLHQIALQCTNN